MLVDVIPDLGNWLVGMADHPHTIQALVTHLPHGHWQDSIQQLTQHHGWTLLQSGDGHFDTDTGKNFREAWNHFVKTGQVWALMFGVVLGYLIKQFTTFG